MVLAQMHRSRRRRSALYKRPGDGLSGFGASRLALPFGQRAASEFLAARSYRYPNGAGREASTFPFASGNWFAVHIDPQRQSANEWYRHTLFSRLNDKRHGAIVIIMQLLHEDDLVGYVLAQEDWEVLSFASPHFGQVPFAMNPLSPSRSASARASCG